MCVVFLVVCMFCCLVVDVLFVFLGGGDRDLMTENLQEKIITLC